MRFTLHRNVTPDRLDLVLPAACKGKAPLTLRKGEAYDVLAFADSVVVSKVAAKALREAESVRPDHLILAGRDFTVEARQLIPPGATLIAQDFGWTDASYWKIKQPRSRT